MDTKLKIEKQKEVAKKVFGRLKKLCYGAILAGGAPRDWFFGTPANDLDFYFYGSEEECWKTKEQLKLCGFEEELTQTEGELESGLYKSTEGIIRVLNTNIEGVDVQLIQLDSAKSLNKVVDGFSVSVCKIWCGDDLKPKIHQDFALTVKTWVMFLSEGYNYQDPHPKKIVDRYRGKFSLRTKDVAIQKLLRATSGELESGS